MHISRFPVTPSQLNVTTSSSHPRNIFSLTLCRAQHQTPLSQAPSQKSHLQCSGCIRLKIWIRKTTLPPSFGRSLLSHPGAAAPAQPPCVPIAFILHPFPALLSQPATPCAIGHLGYGTHGCHLLPISHIMGRRTQWPCLI